MKIFIGCSSSDKIDQKYIGECYLLLSKLFDKDNELVFGSCEKGLMGLSYRIAKQNNCFVTGILSEIYKDEFKKINCDKEIITKGINKRTDMLISKSDLLLFLPGGIGTIYEFFVALERKRNHEFDKPIILYNCNSFYDDLIHMLEKMYDEKFISQMDRTNYLIFSDYESILEYIEKYKSKTKRLIK